MVEIIYDNGQTEIYVDGVLVEVYEWIKQK